MASLQSVPAFSFYMWMYSLLENMGPAQITLRKHWNYDIHPSARHKLVLFQILLRRLISFQHFFSHPSKQVFTHLC